MAPLLPGPVAQIFTWAHVDDGEQMKTDVST